MGDWKLVQVSAKEEESKSKKVKKKTEAASSERLELYNLASDIGESKNLAISEPERVAMMRSTLHEILKNAVPLGEPIQQ
jgi:hypothetical protein